MIREYSPGPVAPGPRYPSPLNGSSSSVTAFSIWSYHTPVPVLSRGLRRRPEPDACAPRAQQNPGRDRSAPGSRKTFEARHGRNEIRRVSPFLHSGRCAGGPAWRDLPGWRIPSLPRSHRCALRSTDQGPAFRRGAERWQDPLAGVAAGAGPAPSRLCTRAPGRCRPREEVLCALLSAG